MIRSCLASLLFSFTYLVNGFATAEVTAIRTGQHPEYFRLVLDGVVTLNPDKTPSGEGIVWRLSSPVADGVSLPEIPGGAQKYLASWSLEKIGGGTVLSVRLKENAKARLVNATSLSYIDFSAVADIQTPRDASALSQSEKDQLDGLRAAVTAMNAADTATRAEQESETGVDKRVMPETAAPLATVAETEPEPAQDDPSLRSRMDALDVSVENRPDETRLIYNWDVVVPAAVFQRAQTLWVVFESPTVIDHPDAVFSGTERVRGVEQIRHPFGTVLRYDLAPDQSIIAERENTRWRIEIKETLVRPRDPIVVTRQIDPKEGKRVFFLLGEAGSRFVLNDPIVGDQIIVVPSGLDGKGVSTAVEASGFHALKTAQGVAITHLADGVNVRRYRNGAAVFAQSGLKLSETGGELAAAEGGRAVRLIDLAGWAGDPNIAESKRNHALLREIAMAPENRLNDRRSAYARFLIGRGFALDAIGVMQLMLEADQTLLKNPTYRAMRGVARLQARQFAGAYEDLMSPSLDTEPDAYLWRAVAAQEIGKTAEAITYFQRGADVLSLYDAADQARFQLAVVNAAKSEARDDILETELGRLEALAPPQPYRAWAEYERAMLHMRTGDVERAKGILGPLAIKAPRQVQARAVLALSDNALSRGEATHAETIERLERLRFAWRGDRFELDLLEYLSSLYWHEKNYRESLSSLRQATSYFPINERTRAFGAIMERRFEALFLDGLADDLDPVTALALYYDFRELTPLGKDGDTMVRRLADRLVNVELFDRAAQLLDHQVTYRLEGVAQAAVAERLAMVHLLNRAPQEAIKVLRTTRAVNMPTDLRTSRYRIEARALIDTQRYQEAIVTLEADQSRQADMLRADAAWGAKDWALVRSTARALLEDAAPNGLSDDARRHILRWSIAATLGNKPEELAILRERFGVQMRRGLYADAFEAIVGSTAEDGSAMPRLTNNLADVGTLEAFMDSYRAAFKPQQAEAGETTSR